MSRAIVIASTAIATDESLTGPRIVHVTTLQHVAYTGPDGPLFSTAVFDTGVTRQSDPTPSHARADAERVHQAVCDVLTRLYAPR